ncbi:helix-turn-helix transcriptional regulator [Paraburkholderia sp. HP33-1]|uniref:helix-turn-helix transcriptional regulator n=1 Tax=Paraburkholderia sp. HP33-1 TaxID=2883243 RepID=UPI001F2C5005|nr:helix-turn-helix transcriptional regulator [Paraburkholderia sp. HP33-1]
MMHLVEQRETVEHMMNGVSAIEFPETCMTAERAERAELRDRAIHAVYESVLEDEPWRKCVGLLTEYFEASSTTIVVRPPKAYDMGYLVCIPGHAPTELAYCSRWYESDPFVELPPERVVLASDVLTGKQWFSSEYYREFLSHMMTTDLRRMLGVNIVTRAGTVSRVRVHRTQDMPPFTDEDRRRLGQFVPHIKQAMALAAHVNRKESERQIFEEGLDRLNIGVVLLDETGRLLRATAVASNLLIRSDGLKAVDRTLEGCSRADTRELQRLLSSSQEHPGMVVATSLSRPSGRRNLAVMVRSIPLLEETEGKLRPAWAVFIRDPDANADAARDILRQLFDFTPAESQLAIELTNGLSLDEAAEKLGIRRNTARAHLRAIFSKAGVTRQSELVRVMLNAVIGPSAAEK